MRIILTIFTLLAIVFVIFVTNPPVRGISTVPVVAYEEVSAFKGEEVTPNPTSISTNTPTSKESLSSPQEVIEEASDLPLIKLIKSGSLNDRWGLIRSDWKADPANPLNFDESDWISAEEIFKQHILSVHVIGTQSVPLGRVFKLSSEELIYLSYFEEATYIDYLMSNEVDSSSIARLPITIDPSLAKLNRVKAPKDLIGPPLPLIDKGVIIDVGQSVLIINGGIGYRLPLYSMGVVSKTSNPDAPPLVYELGQWWIGHACKRGPEDEPICDQKKFDFIVEASYLTYELGSPVFDLKSQTVIGVVVGVIQREHSDDTGAAQQVFVQSIDRFRKQQ